MEQLTTICMPVYNGEKYLMEMLDSIAAQTYRPLQIILSDDKSTDSSVSIMRRWRKKNLSQQLDILIIKGRKHCGLTSNVNGMRRYIKGGIVMFADQDDIWERDKVEKQVLFLEKYPDDMVCICDRSLIDKKGNWIRKRESQPYGPSSGHQDFSKIIRHEANCGFNAIAVRNRHLDILLNMPEHICEQDTYITVMASCFGRIGFLKERLVRYRIHENNLSGNYFLKMNRNFWKAYLTAVRKNKRFNAMCNYDGILIEEKLNEYFNIELKSFQNGLLGRKCKKIYRDAFSEVWSAAVNKELGAWVS